MPRSFLLACGVVLFTGTQLVFAVQGNCDEPTLAALQKEFQTYSGAEIVFLRRDLPEGRYHDVLKPLADSGRAAAAAICVAEAKMYPPGYFREVGLKSVGVFAACASKTSSDRSRPFDEQLGGYRYFGVYNGTDAVAAAFYSEGQLALTLHHEIFHHVDSTVDGESGTWNLSTDDAFYQAAISGLRPYRSPQVAGHDLNALRNRCIGYTLKDSVSQYAAKNSREDQAETARHVMSMLANSLVQTIDHPELPGSQRILHILREYEASVPDGPGVDWFVDVALDRARREAKQETAEGLLVQLTDLASRGRSGFAGVTDDPTGARATLSEAVRLKSDDVDASQAAEMVKLASEITNALLRQRIRPDATDTRFDVWGREDAAGVNRTLRHDVAQVGRDSKRLQRIAARLLPTPDALSDKLVTTHLRNLRLIARYYLFIDSNWSITQGTKDVFESTRDSIVASLPEGKDNLRQKLHSASMLELAQRNVEDPQP